MIDHSSKKSAFVVIFLLGLIVLHSKILSAGITNEGKDAVVILATKENGSSQATIYPGQTIPIPENTKSLKVLPPTSTRGDEQTKVRIAQDNTVVLYLNKIGDSVNLGEPQPEETAAAEYRKVTNLGNIAINIIVRKNTGFSDTITVMPLQSITLVPEAEEVEVAPIGSMRGDENIDVDVVLLSGQVRKLESIGARVRLDFQES